MKIDESAINHNAIRLIEELVSSRYDLIDSEKPNEEIDYILMTIGEIGGVLEMARAMKGVLKE